MNNIPELKMLKKHYNSCIYHAVNSELLATRRIMMEEATNNATEISKMNIVCGYCKSKLSAGEIRLVDNDLYCVLCGIKL